MLQMAVAWPCSSSSWEEQGPDLPLCSPRREVGAHFSRRVRRCQLLSSDHPQQKRLAIGGGPSWTFGSQPTSVKDRLRCYELRTLLLHRLHRALSEERAHSRANLAHMAKQLVVLIRPQLHGDPHHAGGFVLRLGHSY